MSHDRCPYQDRWDDVENPSRELLEHCTTCATCREALELRRRIDAALGVWTEQTAAAAARIDTDPSVASHPSTASGVAAGGSAWRRAGGVLAAVMLVASLMWMARPGPSPSADDAIGAPASRVAQGAAAPQADALSVQVEPHSSWIALPQSTGRDDVSFALLLPCY